jgi:ankyrin repeat protein
MAGTYSHHVKETTSPQYAYALVILSGGVAFTFFQQGQPVTGLLIYAVVAALFACLWPDRALRWAAWLCLPVIMLICFDVITTANPMALLRSGPIFAKALPTACLGAYLGSKFTVRRITASHSHAPAKRKRPHENSSHARKILSPKESAASATGLNLAASEPDSNGSAARAAEQFAPAESLNAELVKAARACDLDEIERLATDGADVNARFDDSSTPLMIAVGDGDMEMVSALFGRGAAVDPANNAGATALMIATIEGHLEIVRALLERGVQVNAQDERGWTALRFAVSMNETEILRLLLDAGADVNLADKDGATALMQAAGENSTRSLKALLDAGADPFIKDRRGQTALTIARGRGHAKVVALLKAAEARAAAHTDTAAGVSVKDDSYFYLLKEELEEGLNSYPHSSSADEVVLRASSALKALQEHLDAAKHEGAACGLEISHKLTLNLKEAAALSGLPRRHLLESIEAGALKARQIDYVWHIRRTDLDDFIARLC